MTKAGRDPEEDRQATRDVILGRRERGDGKRNWLGHEIPSGNAEMDDLLVRGATMEELKATRRKPANQLYHLRKDHQLKIVKGGDGLLRFDHADLGILPSDLGPPVLSARSSADSSILKQAPRQDDEDAGGTGTAEPNELESLNPGSDTSSQDSPLFGSAEANAATEKAAVNYATKRLTAAGWSVRSVEVEKCGYDLFCERGAEELHVEVKGTQKGSSRFMITAGELRQAKTDPLFSLVWVSHALSASPISEQYSGSELLTVFEFTPLSYVARRV